MGNNNALVVTVTLNGQAIDLLTRNGNAYVLSGTGPNDFAEAVPVDNMSEVQKSAAINTNNYGETPLGVELAEDAGIIKKPGELSPENAEELRKAKDSFDNAVNYLENLSGNDFTNLVIYSQINDNRFPENIKELDGAVNADDAWCTAIINKSRKINEEVEQAMFDVFTFDRDFIITLRNKKNTSIEAKVAAYKAMFDDECANMVWAYNELNRLERVYREFMVDIKN